MKRNKQVQELRSAALACFSGSFDLILFEAVDFEFIFEKGWFGEVCFGSVWIDSLDQTFFASVEFGLIWFGCSTDKQFVFGYSTDKQTNK